MENKDYEYFVDLHERAHEESNKRFSAAQIFAAMIASALIGCGAHAIYCWAIDLSTPKIEKTVDEIHAEMLSHNYSYCPYCGESFKIREKDLSE